ncbi:hypothetical protein [Paenibacillus sp. GCM10023250]|uniref:hypothetical protein n=1 Tax=Paenibacillus sp. GCM10023250 TaxID=3252648 RepID=UPI00360DC005
MNNFRDEYRNRYYQANVSTWGTVQLHQRNPHVVAMWSVAFPGFGHFLCERFVTGFALFFWEFYINQVTHLNTAMMYSFNGEFDRAKAVLDEKHIYLYIPVYLFAIWDSYRMTVDGNKVQVLAKRENAKFPTFAITPFGCAILSKKDPWIAFAWAMAFPSLGQLYLFRCINALLTLVMTITVLLNSNLVEGIHYCMLFDFAKAREVVDEQWSLYFPSIYFYGIYETYTNAVEISKLYNNEQANFLKEHHQSEHFVLYKGEKIE